MTNKKRVLLVTQFSQLPTGYGVYANELLHRLKAFGYEVAELACNCCDGDERIANVPWRVYPNQPHRDDPDYNHYESSPTFSFGEFTFNSVLLNFQPTHVLDYRDPWNFTYESYSPFRSYFNWIISPTNDAAPLNPDWIETFGEAEAVLSYSEFGRDVMLKQGRVNFMGVASPGASHSFYQYDTKRKNILRAQYGINPDAYVMGTVMRNQPRKLFPDLFKSFRAYLDRSGREDVFLYCHTAFPDLGWNIPELLAEHKLSNKVYFTYKCCNCGNVTARLFSDTLVHCTKCDQFRCNIAGVGNGLETKELAEVYNLFDWYVQYSSMEGYGMPILEAAYAGLPIACVNYSSMESFVENLDAIPIKVLHLEKESGTGRNQATPSNDDFVDVMYDLFSLYKNELYDLGTQFSKRARDKYSWDKCAQMWINAIESTPVKPHDLTWGSQPIAVDPAPLIDKFMKPSEQAEYLIKEVLREPRFMYKGLWRRLVKDLTYTTTLPSSGLLYFHEDYNKDTLRHRTFSFANAYEQIKIIREHYNTWQDNRAKVMSGQ
jgi:glycosyltransferase involved in cell wall biosynthesis